MCECARARTHAHTNWMSNESAALYSFIMMRTDCVFCCCCFLSSFLGCWFVWSIERCSHGHKYTVQSIMRPQTLFNPHKYTFKLNVPYICHFHVRTVFFFCLIEYKTFLVGTMLRIWLLGHKNDEKNDKLHICGHIGTDKMKRFSISYFFITRSKSSNLVLFTRVIYDTFFTVLPWFQSKHTLKSNRIAILLHTISFNHLNSFSFLF